MSTASEPSSGASVPQPAATAEELRAALARIAPDAVPTFDAERATAVALLRSLEARAARVTDPAEARAIAAEIGHILDKAAAEAGIPHGGAR
ncbi:hypothetical protein [Streptomyces sp. NPDC002054]|uniref:hypothetical protein n=1 Tax=Streptomyces sp. NPDC002054 TaxID=3154663 RepID=UPI00331AC513